MQIDNLKDYDEDDLYVECKIITTESLKYVFNLICSYYVIARSAPPPTTQPRPINRTYFCSFAYITFKSNTISPYRQMIYSFQTLQFLE